MYKLVSIEDIPVNKENDRHGNLLSEEQSIGWLFKKYNNHMRNLARSIAENGSVLEVPLLLDSNGRFVLKDGNRRVTCLKLLNKPAAAPTVELTNFFEALVDQFQFTPLTEISCRVESDPNFVDQLIALRHLGSQEGVGVSPWNDRMKHNFARRTGHRAEDTPADFIESLLIDKKLLPKDFQIPRSTTNRLFSSNKLLARFDIRKSTTGLEYVGSDPTKLQHLSRIARDFAERKKTLPDVWDAKSKEAYLLEVFDGCHQSAPEIKSSDTPPIPRRSKSLQANGVTRDTLIPRDLARPNWKADSHKILYVWEELSHDLRFPKNTMSIAVMFRVLVELSAANYVAVNGLNPRDQTLKSLLFSCIDHLIENDLITVSQKDDYSAVISGSQIFSIKTMQRYVHSPYLMPSPDSLRSHWDSLQSLILLCLHEER